MALPPSKPGKLSGFLLRLAVVFLVVDFLADLVLLAIDSGLFLVGQVSAVFLAIPADFLVDLGLVVLDTGGFARSQLAALDAVGDAFLLVLLALLDFGFLGRILGERVGCCSGEQRAAQNSDNDSF